MTALGASPIASFASFWSSAKDQFTSGSLDWKLVVGICVSPSLLTGAWRIFCGTESGSLPCSPCWRWWSFQMFGAHHHAWESGRCLSCLLLWAYCDYKTSFGKDVETIQASLTSRQCGRCCCQRFRQFRKSINVVFKVGGVAVAHQLRKGQQNLVCSYCCRGVSLLNCGC